MMITIYGASDDCVEVEGCGGADEFYADGDGRWHGDLVGPDPADQLRVWCWYDGYGGAWQVGAGQVIEDVTMASWPVSFGQHASGYSAVLTIDAPDGTRLTNVKPARDA